MILNLLLTIPELVIDSTTIALLQEIVKNSSKADPKGTFDSFFQIFVYIASAIGCGWALINYIIKKRLERKEKQTIANLDRVKTEQIHSNKLEIEMFQFDKEKYVNSRESDQNFQKTIINEIFGKFVEQSQWITNLHDKSIESLVTQMTNVNKVTKDIYIQNDVISNRIRNVEDRVIKNTNIIIAKLDTLIKLQSAYNATVMKNVIEKKSIVKRDTKK